MNSVERKSHLFEKARANLQRRRRETFLASLPPDLRSYLETCECIYTPEAHAVLERFHPATESGIGYKEKLLPTRYSFQETCEVDRALAIAGQLISSHDDAEGMLLLTPPTEIWTAEPSDAVLVPDLPLFRVRFGWGRQSYARLWKYSTHAIALVLLDLSAGLIIDSYYGVLEDDVNAEGVVYEVVSWG